jgi:hypothetical protein
MAVITHCPAYNIERNFHVTITFIQIYIFYFSHCKSGNFLYVYVSLFKTHDSL